MKVVCFIGGMIVGVVLAYFIIDKQFLSPLIYNGATANAGSYRQILTVIREGKTNDAIDLLETKLDGELVTFLNYDKNQPKINLLQFKIISRIAAYRQEHPRKTENPEVDAAVQKVLAMPTPKPISP